MPDLSTIRAQVEDRLNELEGLIAPLRAELEELKAVAESFTSNGAATPAPVKRARRAATPKTAAKAAGAPARPARPAATPRRSRRSARSGGSRAQQAISLIADRPGMTVPEMAKAMGIGSNYLYRVLPQLDKDGKVRKQGKGYHPVDAPADGGAAQES